MPSSILRWVRLDWMQVNHEFTNGRHRSAGFNMPTFIDESGETGQVSPYFRLAAVWLPTQVAVEAYRAGIQQFQQDAGLEGYEYKSSKSLSLERRIAYFQAAMGHPFRFAVASVDKQHPEWRAAGASVLHWACVVSLAVSLRSVYLEEEARRAAAAGGDHPLNELVVLDDNRDSKFLAVIKQKFRELRSGVRAGSPLVGKVKFRGSGAEELIQLVDMVCGAVGDYLDGDGTCYNIISTRDLGITRIP
jgi:hypothetical protein